VQLDFIQALGPSNTVATELGGATATQRVTDVYDGPPPNPLNPNGSRGLERGRMETEPHGSRAGRGGQGNKRRGRHGAGKAAGPRTGGEFPSSSKETGGTEKPTGKEKGGTEKAQSTRAACKRAHEWTGTRGSLPSEIQGRSEPEERGGAMGEVAPDQTGGHTGNNKRVGSRQTFKVSRKSRT
jgi:hypothetical protein